MAYDLLILFGLLVWKINTTKNTFLYEAFFILLIWWPFFSSWFRDETIVKCWSLEMYQRTQRKWFEEIQINGIFPWFWKSIDWRTKEAAYLGERRKWQLRWLISSSCNATFYASLGGFATFSLFNFTTTKVNLLHLQVVLQGTIEVLCNMRLSILGKNLFSKVVSVTDFFLMQSYFTFLRFDELSYFEIGIILWNILVHWNNLEQ